MYIAVRFELYQPGFEPLVYRKSVLVANLRLGVRIRAASVITSAHCDIGAPALDGPKCHSIQKMITWNQRGCAPQYLNITRSLFF
jgi:hypothetical protein